jgi:hypothetical protein
MPLSSLLHHSGASFGLNEFENSAFNVGDSLKQLGNGVCLSCLVNAGKLELHYSEFGIGGGHEGNVQVSSVCLGWVEGPPHRGCLLVFVFCGCCGLTPTTTTTTTHPPLPQIAQNAAGAAREPWAGVAGSYDAGRDPWRRPDLAEFRRSFYYKTMEWLGKPSIRTYQV